MIIDYKLFYSRNLYNFFLFSSLILFFFSTDHFQTKAFEIKNIEISKPFEMKFNNFLSKLGNDFVYIVNHKNTPFIQPNEQQFVKIKNL